MPDFSFVQLLVFGFLALVAIIVTAGSLFIRFAVYLCSGAAFVAIESWLTDCFNHPWFYGQATLAIITALLAAFAYIQLLRWSFRRRP